MTERALGVDVGGTKIAAGVIDRDGKILNRIERPTPTESRDEFLEQLDEIVDQLRGDGVGAIGFGLPSTIDQRTGRVVGSVHVPLADFDFRDHAAERFSMGKDNIVFHTVIWPSILLGYGTGGEVGAGKPLELPDDIVASEFLTMEGKQFSVSRGISIAVGDFLSRYDPDPLRYFLTAAGPETQDTDFTWSEFVRRNNDELVANWGNLVNRTLSSAHKNFGAVPEPGELTAEDSELLDAIAAGFDVVGEQIEAARFRAALGEAMKLATLVNRYTDHQAPWALIESDRERAGTVLYVALRAIDSLKTIFAPFLPFSSQAVHELLGNEGTIAGPLELREVGGDDDPHEVLTGDYVPWIGSWAPSELVPGQTLQKPRPLFKKLDPDVVVPEELARMEAHVAAPE